MLNKIRNVFFLTMIFMATNALGSNYYIGTYGSVATCNGSKSGYLGGLEFEMQTKEHSKPLTISDIFLWPFFEIFDLVSFDVATGEYHCKTDNLGLLSYEANTNFSTQFGYSYMFENYIELVWKIGITANSGSYTGEEVETKRIGAFGPILSISSRYKIGDSFYFAGEIRSTYFESKEDLVNSTTKEKVEEPNQMLVQGLAKISIGF